MYVYMYIYIYVHIYICMCIYICIHIAPVKLELVVLRQKLAGRQREVNYIYI